MEPAGSVMPGRLRFDAVNECLWQGDTAIALRPKAFAVLKHLVDHAGQLVTKQQLLEAVWPGTFVGDAVLKDSIRQVREALGDDATSPIYIATSHRRGYRFIGHFSQAAASPVASPVSPSVLGFPKGLHDAAPVAPRLLGRNAELAAMRGWLERAWRESAR